MANYNKYERGEMVICVENPHDDYMLTIGHYYEVLGTQTIEENDDGRISYHDVLYVKHMNGEKFHTIDYFEKRNEIFQKPHAEDEQVLGVDVSSMCPSKVVEEFDDVTKPSHYASGGIEPMDYAKANFTHEEFRGAMKFNINKYIHRFDKKGTPVKDLMKSNYYLERLIEHESNES